MDTKKLRQKILDLAIRGKLVPQDPNDEPASVLLERIRAEKEQLIKEGKIKRTKKSVASDTSHYENMPFEVPENWEWVNIMEILLKLTDGTHHSPKNYPKGNYKYITAKNIKNEGIVLDDVTYVDDETHHEIFSRCNPEYGDILYIKDGATTGVVAINNLTEDFSLLSSVALLKPSKLVSNKYLFYYLQSSYCYESVRSSMKGVGITRITLKQIADWDVPIPPIGEQHRIVEYIDSLFSQIDLIAKDTSTLKSFLEKYKHGILDLAIAGKLVPQDPSEEPAVELLMRINPTYKSCDNRHYRQLPDSWQVVKIKDVFTINPKNKVDDDIDAGFVSMSMIDDGYRDSYQFEKKKWSLIKGGFTHFQDGDIAVAKISPCLENRKSMILKNLPNGIGAGTTELHVFRSAIVYPKFALYFFKSDYFINHCVGTFNGVVGQQRVGKNIIEDIIFPLPTYEEQKRISEKITHIFECLDKITAEL